MDRVLLTGRGTGGLERVLQLLLNSKAPLSHETGSVKVTETYCLAAVSY